MPLVVGGVKAKEKEFPHMVREGEADEEEYDLKNFQKSFLLQVAIGYGEDTATAKWMCGGSLISEIYVLSAAHCSKSKSRY